MGTRRKGSQTPGERQTAAALQCLVSVGQRKARRRSLLGAAAGTVAGAVLCGCSDVFKSAIQGLVPARLRIGLVGFPTSVGSELSEAVQQCARLYEEQTGGQMTLEIHTEQIPEMGWYSNSVGPGTVPQATGISSTGLFEPQTNLGSLAPQLPIGGGLVVSGRTSLGVSFGAPPSAVQVAAASDLRDIGPDVVLAYTTWQFWLAPLAQKISGAADTYSAYLDGVAPKVKSFGDFFLPGEALTSLGFPVLRNPMALFFSSGVDAEVRSANPSWTWEGMIRWFRGPGSHVSTGSFLELAAFPEGTESALAMVASYGGAVGQVLDARVMERYTDAVSLPGLKAWSSIVTSGVAQWMGEGTPTQGVPVPGSYVVPQHLWSPLWGDRAQWNPTWNAYPLPAGPRGRRVPCTYLCAFVMLGNTAGPLAEEFAAFLWSPAAQAVLGGSSVGLPLRFGQAVDVATERYPWMKTPVEFADAATDLALTDLYGDVTALKDGTGLARVSDAFAAHLGRIESAVNITNGVP